MRLFNIFLVALIFLAVSLVLISAQDPDPVTITTDETDEVAETIVDFTVETAESTATTLEDFVDRLFEAPKSDLIRILLVIGGVILLIAGWRVYDYIVIIAGFLIGAAIFMALVSNDNTVLLIAAFLMGGVIGAIAGIFLYRMTVFVIGAYVGVLLTVAIADVLSLTPVSSLVLLFGALIGGLILIGLSFQFLVILSALVGAQMLTLGLNLASHWTIIFIILGTVIQFGLMHNFKYNFRRYRSNRFRNMFPRIRFG